MAQGAGLGSRMLEPALLHTPKHQLCLAGLMPQPHVTKPSGFSPSWSKINPIWSPTLWHWGSPVQPLGAPQLKPQISTSTHANAWTFVHQHDPMAAGQAPRQLPTQLLLLTATAPAMQIQPGNTPVLLYLPPWAFSVQSLDQDF